MEAEWATVSGRGAVYTYTIPHHAVHPGFADAVPYIVAVVDLAEGVRFLSNLVECAVGDVHIGMPVEVVFKDVTDTVSLPLFKPILRADKTLTPSTSSVGRN